MSPSPRVAGRRRARAGHEPALDSAARFLQETHDFYVTLDEDGVVLSWNRAAVGLFGYSEHEAVGQPLEALIVPSHLHAAHLGGIARFRETGSGRGLDGPVEVAARHADGATVPVELSIWAERTGSGYVFHALGHDLSQRQQHQRVLEVLAAHRRGLLLSESPEEARHLLCTTVLHALRCQGVYLLEVDGPGRLRRSAQAVDRAQGFGDVVEVDGRLLRGLERPGPGYALTVADLGADGPSGLLRGTGLSTFVVQPVHRSGLVAVLVLGWYDVGRQPADGERSLIDLLASEAVLVLERLEAQGELRRAAVTDALTGLGNRRSFDEDLAAAVRTAARGPLSLVVLDLDRFKAYNDAHGHPAGDALLVGVAAAWRSALPEGTGLYRLGGDEFAVVLPGCDHAEAEEMAALVRRATPEVVGVTAGVAQLRGGQGPDTLLQRADAALYLAKHARS